MYRQLLESSPKSVREAVTLRAATMLASYRKNCATASSSGQLILPECMKLLPLYVNCMMVCSIFCYSFINIVIAIGYCCLQNR